MRETRTLAEFVANTRFEDVPADLVERAKGLVLDNIGSGLVGSVQPWSRMVADLVCETGAKPECTVFGQSWRTSPSGAALVNGTMVGGFETDHSFAAGSAHPGAAVFPAALAVAEWQHKDGKAFLTSMILGYEVLCRVGYAATRAIEDERGFHGPGTNSPFGAAMAAGKLLGLDQAGLTNALGIAGSHSAGLAEFTWEGAMVKRLHTGRGSQMGLESALLARKGFTGPSTVLEGKHGFLNVFSPSPHPERLLADLGKVWIIRDLAIKSYACYGRHRAVVEGLVAFKSQHSVDPRTIRRVVITSCRLMMDKHDDKEPTTVIGAQNNLPFAAAVSLTKDIANPLVFNEDTLWDKEVRELARRIETVVDQQRFSPLPSVAAEIVIELDGGRHVINVLDYKGSPRNPFTFEDFCRKFRSFAVQLIGSERVEKVIETVWGLDGLKDLAELAKLVGP